MKYTIIYPKSHLIRIQNFKLYKNAELQPPETGFPFFDPHTHVHIQITKQPQSSKKIKTFHSEISDLPNPQGALSISK